MTENTPSPSYRITFGEGVLDELRACTTRLAKTQQAALKAESYEELARARETTIDQMSSFVNKFVLSLLASNTHDGDVTISVDGPECFFFKYASGYHGAMILHPSGEDPAKASWSVHT